MNPSVNTWDFDPKPILLSGRKVKGIFHQPIIDKDGEYITADAMRKSIPDFMHLPALHDFHKERPVGLATKICELEGGKFYFEGVIKATQDCDDIWEKVSKGNYDQVSIFGKRTKYNNQCALPQNMRSGPCITDGVRLDSISVCDENARNPQTSLEVKKAKVVFDAETIGKAWGRDSEGNFCEIVKASDMSKDTPESWSKTVNKKKRESDRKQWESAGGDPDGQQHPRRYSDDEIEEKAETTDGNLQHASTDYAEEKDMEKGRKVTSESRKKDPNIRGKYSHSGATDYHANESEDEGFTPYTDEYMEKSVRSKTKTPTQRLDDTHTWREKERGEDPGYGQRREVAAIHRVDEEDMEKGNPKVAPRTVRVSQMSKKKGESPGTNLGLSTSTGKSVFAKKCGEKCVKQEPNTISKDVEKADEPPTQGERGTTSSKPTIAKKKIPASSRHGGNPIFETEAHKPSPPKRGNEGGINRVGVAPKSDTKEIENRAAGAGAIMHYEARASHEKYSGDPTKPSEGQVRKKVGHRLGTSTRKASTAQVSDEMGNTKDFAEVEKGTRPKITEEPIPPKTGKKSASGGVRQAKPGEKFEKAEDEEMEKGRIDHRTDNDSVEDDDDDYDGYDESGNKSRTIRERNSTDKTRPAGRKRPNRNRVLKAEEEPMEKSAAEDLEEESYDEDEDSDVDKVKSTDKEQNWSKTKGADGTPGLKKAKDDDEEEESEGEHMQRMYGADVIGTDEEKFLSPKIKKELMKKAQEKGKPEEDDEQDEEEEEEEEEVEKGITDRSPRQFESGSKISDHDFNVAESKLQNKLVAQGKRTPEAAKKRSKEEGSATTASREYDEKSKFKRNYVAEEHFGSAMRNLHKGDITKGDEDTASESFNPSTVTKGEQMDEQENDVEYVTKALVPIEEIDTIVKARTEEISKAYMGQLEEIKKAYDVKFVELTSKIEKMETETIRKGGSVVVIPELLGNTGGSMSNADAIARMQAGR